MICMNFQRKGKENLMKICIIMHTIEKNICKNGKGKKNNKIFCMSSNEEKKNEMKTKSRNETSAD